MLNILSYNPCLKTEFHTNLPKTIHDFAKLCILPNFLPQPSNFFTRIYLPYPDGAKNVQFSQSGLKYIQKFQMLKTKDKSSVIGRCWTYKSVLRIFVWARMGTKVPISCYLTIWLCAMNMAKCIPEKSIKNVAQRH